MTRTLLCLFSLALLAPAFAAKPIVWIYTDMSDKSIPGKNHMGTLNDPDDISAMAGYLLLANEFDTRGIVVTSTHRPEHANTPDQAAWADRTFGTAYRAEVASLNANLGGGFPADIAFTQSCIKKTAERYDPQKTYTSLDAYPTVRSLFDEAAHEPNGALINVLCWGSLTEPAILVNHCLATNRADLLKKLRFIAHWTNSPLHQGTPEHPEHVANCREDAAACAFMKDTAAAGKIDFRECGAIGQHGIVSGAPRGEKYYEPFKVSQLGRLFVEGKFVQGSPDHSDAATYWVLLGTMGVTLADIPADGSNTAAREQTNENKFRATSPALHAELLRRARAAAKPGGEAIATADLRVRDPFILADASTKTYYLYRQIGNGRLDTTVVPRGVEVFTSPDLQTWRGPHTVFTQPADFWADAEVWAPEVHAYRGKYYLFVTFSANQPLAGKPAEGAPPLRPRGTQILVADAPTGPFRPFANRAHTPPEWMSLDGTLWVEDGQPWMIFCHEWHQITDGTMDLVPLAGDLSAPTAAPRTLFSARSAPWVKNLRDVGHGKSSGYVTDGPFVHRTKTGKLLMIWSSFGSERYAIGIAESTTGKITGPWIQQPELLFKADGGHGMIFRTFEGRLMLAFHQPNQRPLERMRLFPLEDTGDTIRLASP